jgi:hypothetical protein
MPYSLVTQTVQIISRALRFFKAFLPDFELEMTRGARYARRIE